MNNHGGDWVASALAAHGVQFVFTLTGGHIAPILVGAKRHGIRVIDTRHEATAVFAADAVARLTGIPGVAVVTAGPGVTNTVTALKNAQMAQSPLVLIGGAAATALRGRGALQDIDQLSLLRSIVKWQQRVTQARDLVSAVAQAFEAACSGVPGPVFLEIPVDLLYAEAVVRQWYGLAREQPKRTQRGSLLSAIQRRAQSIYLGWHVNRLFIGMARQQHVALTSPVPPEPSAEQVERAAAALLQAKRPVLLIGSQAVLQVQQIPELVRALERIGAPIYLSGMARGLLGSRHHLQLRHKRREVLREADLVLLAGVPADFRLDYGNHIPRRATYIAANRSRADLYRNRRPQIAALGDPARFLCMLAEYIETGRQGDKEIGRQGDREAPRYIGRVEAVARSISNTLHPSTASATVSSSERHGDTETQRHGNCGTVALTASDAMPELNWTEWHAALHARDATREAEINQQAEERFAQLNPLHLCREIASLVEPNTMYVADGGDFVATASYIVRPPAPLSWLDPGAFGTLGVGAGFALAAKLVRPQAEVWLLYGDGSAGYGLAEFDTFVRHKIGVIAVVGNDGGWTQIAREQIPMLGDDIATTLAQSDYERVAAGFGAHGMQVSDPELVSDTLTEARMIAATGQPVLVNALISKGEFRKGSLSM